MKLYQKGLAQSESETHGIGLPLPTNATMDHFETLQTQMIAMTALLQNQIHTSVDHVNSPPIALIENTPVQHHREAPLDLEQRLDEMLTQKIESSLTKRKDKRRQMILEEDLFAHEIMVVPLPKRFKQPMIESYDRVTDPLDHL
ncbi:Uncharacterized protein Adt_39451 [Abeliophyllum distichum]|uniref:Uncharacterized protein n=1 Tax=Abeliophyllum distichum TaxID=126358 RepID=A0ABD1Q547_9LAMI